VIWTNERYASQALTAPMRYRTLSLSDRGHVNVRLSFSVLRHRGSTRTVVVADTGSVDADYDNGVPFMLCLDTEGVREVQILQRLPHHEEAGRFYRLHVGPRKLGQRRMWRSGQRSGRTARWIWAWRSSHEEVSLVRMRRSLLGPFL
jgi:hypothetical protein